ncbi:MAG: TetR/AcrR family transcriptional regulator [Coriobacteriales bacterium]|jgi:AcrR family transcriptional regulator|nr:TetR/AcrR family transcriptional regulator [Coriobacteriales bacterium]
MLKRKPNTKKVTEAQTLASGNPNPQTLVSDNPNVKTLASDNHNHKTLASGNSNPQTLASGNPIVQSNEGDKHNAQSNDGDNPNAQINANDSAEPQVNTDAFGIATIELFEPLLKWGISERFQPFMRLDEVKRSRIISAMLDEFSAKPYTAASTNNIVKEAGISKGLLFHYFGDKAGAYCFMLEHTMQSFVGDYQQSFPAVKGDVFDILLSATYGKLQTTMLLRRETALFIRFMTDDLPDELVKMRGKYLSLSRNTMDLVTYSLDEKRLRKNINKEQAAKVISWVCEGLTQEALATISPDDNERFLEDLTEYVDGYITLLRALMYKDA